MGYNLSLGMLEKSKETVLFFTFLGGGRKWAGWVGHL